MDTIIFDLDGTLVDSVDAIYAVSQKTLLSLGLPDIPHVQIRSFIGHGVHHLTRSMARFLALDPAGSKADEIYRIFSELYPAQLDGNHCFIGVPEALKELQIRGHHLALCTNKPMAPARSVLNHLGLLKFFPAVVAGDSLASRKPEPEMLHAAIQQTAGNSAVYIGDSEVDQKTALNADIPFVLFTEGYRASSIDELNPRAHFSSYSELPDLLQNINALKY